MTEKQVLTKKEAKAHMEEIETFIATLPYEGETVLEKAGKRETMLSELMAKKAHEYYVNEVDMRLQPEKLDSVQHDLSEEIDVLEHRLNVYKETATPKEAYFNILKDRSLQKNTPYVMYAGNYVYEVVKDIYEQGAFKTLEIHVSQDSANRLPVVVLEFAHKYRWGVKDHLNDSQKGHWFMFPNMVHDIPLSTLRHSNYSARNFERTLEHIQKVKEDIEKIEAGRKKYKRRYFFLPHIKKRVDNNCDTLIERQKQRLVRDYSELLNEYEAIVDQSPEEWDNQKETITNEMLQMIALLKDRLGLEITTDLDE